MSRDEILFLKDAHVTSKTLNLQFGVGVGGIIVWERGEWVEVALLTIEVNSLIRNKVDISLYYFQWITKYDKVTKIHCKSKFYTFIFFVGWQGQFLEIKWKHSIRAPTID